MAGESVPFGPYELIRRIGAGGMAETFLAVRRGPGGFEQRVCLKRILSAYESDAELVEMFLAEARVSASLRHANITQVLDFGEAEGLHYLALEMIDGVDLRALLKSMSEAGETLAAGVVAHLARELCGALQHAHRQGVVHRDVSPSNVLCSRAGEVKLTDFGIAKAKSLPDLTATGVVKGKVPYMAPEYAGRAVIDARGDLFSLGVTLFECLAGKRPYDGATDLETLGRSSAGDHESLRRLAPHATPLLADVVERLIRPDPAERFESAAELQEALCAEPPPAAAPKEIETLVMRHEKAPPSSSFVLPRSRSGAVRPPARTGRLLLALGAVAAILIGVVIGMLTPRGETPDRSREPGHDVSGSARPPAAADDAGPSPQDAATANAVTVTDAAAPDAAAAGDAGATLDASAPRGRERERERRPPEPPSSALDQARIEQFQWRATQMCRSSVQPATGQTSVRTTAIFDVAPGGNYRLRFVPPIPDALRRCIVMNATQFQLDATGRDRQITVRLVLTAP